jgi:threonine dehydratase
MIAAPSKILSRAAIFARRSQNDARLVPSLQNAAIRYKSSTDKSTEPPPDAYKYPLNEDGDCPPSPKNSEIVSFPAVDPSDPAYNEDLKPVLLNAKEHVVGYLSKILNARVYDAAIETQLQHAKNLSSVR